MQRQLCGVDRRAPGFTTNTGQGQENSLATPRASTGVTGPIMTTGTSVDFMEECSVSSKCFVGIVFLPPPSLLSREGWGRGSSGSHLWPSAELAEPRSSRDTQDARWMDAVHVAEVLVHWQSRR